MSPRKTVLVVEDEPIIRSLVSLVLEAKGYAVDGASDGREALVSIEQTRPDALVIDLDLPIMDGFELVRPAVPRMERGTFPSSSSLRYIAGRGSKPWTDTPSYRSRST